MVKLIDALSRLLATAPNPDWLPFLKLTFGFCGLFILAGLALFIAKWDVKAETSAGLEMVLGGLINQSGGFAQWAFGETRRQISTSISDIAANLDKPPVSSHL